MSDALNALVEERIFGRKILGTAACGWSQDGSGLHVLESATDPDITDMLSVYAHPSWNGEKCADDVVIGGVPACWLSVVRDYSTDIAAAWEVVEKTLAWREDVRFCIYLGCACRPTAQFFVVNTGTDLALAHATTAPLAICLAALCAVGVTESEIEAARNQTKGPQ